MSWQRLSRPAATFSCSTMALFTKPKRSCWPIILSPSSSRLTHPNSILLSGSGVTSKINWRVTCLPPWRNFLSRWLKLSIGIQPLTYAHLQRSLTSSRLLSQLMYTNHKETVLPTQLGAAAKTASEGGYNQVRVFVQDESRLGLLPIVRHRITARGVQPTISSAYRFESFYLYGAVEPATGESFLLELPCLNTNT